MKKVTVFGVFDLLHPGHLYFLKQAKRHGAYLTVVVTRDARVLREKGSKPFFNEKERLAIVQSLAIVDKAILGDKPGQWSIYKKIHPNIIAVGYDQQHHIQNADRNKTIRFVYIKPWKPSRYNSSNVKKQYARH